ncbi:hypothetical protein K435DRAFT_807548 [Dendrothele bispora CBS 962.96]|uniref:Uncharacterized protein n=1 Tax=Dendrothele bispora (strain CBS 962.96) TaxID=1314807 RepID=A0A4S8L4C3_DENBC|nr:hypothetical protein K435DRAFT_807548 [Dendrothele bispora CBS 962.96]
MVHNLALEGDTYSKPILSDSPDQELSGDTQTLGIQEEELSYRNPTRLLELMYLPSSQSDFDTLRMIAVPAMHFETPILLVADFKSKIFLSNHGFYTRYGTFHKGILISPMSYSGGKSGIFNAVQRYEVNSQGQPVTSDKDNVGLYMIGTILLLLYNPDSISLSELRDCVEIPDTIPVIRGSMLEQISTVISKAELQNQTQLLRRSKHVAGQNNENQSLKTRYDEETLQWNSLGKSKWAYAPSSQ